MNKKLIFCIVITVILTSCFFMLSGFSLMPYEQDYNYAYIYNPNGLWTSGKLEEWHLSVYSSTIEVKIDGKVYYTHSSNVYLTRR